ncbi:hypothetical protein VPNG_08007 [Cytospora leucostoma]|uniref:2EXR domain-containing protein n=1 Tax=Cytospora leucostoma TaxID=1230097 RepID=A0A423WRL8_9PEZI|nr:hypothetical protein VPNG_08007 [Cytospora leucostoma]
MDGLLAFHGTLQLEGLPQKLSSILRNQEKMIEDARRRDRQQEERDRRQQLFEERVLSELDDLRGRLRALDATSPATFPQFQRLPKEIKQMIWALTIPRRAHKIVREDIDSTDDDDDYFAKNMFKSPAITQVCAESRAVALRHGQCHTIRQCWPWDQETRTSWHWFFPELDILILTHGSTREGRGVRTAAKRIFLECGQRFDESPFFEPQDTLRYNLYGQKHSPTVQMPNLEAAYVGYRLNIGCEVGTSFMREFFGDDEVLLVDMEDTVAVSRVTRLLEETRGKRSEYSPQSAREAVMLKRFTEDYQKGLSVLRRILLLASAETAEARRDCLTEDDRPNTALAWVRETLDSFKFRPGMLLVRDPKCDPEWPGSL